MQLAGKVALITGASSGIGLATAKLLSEQGAKVALLGRDVEELQGAIHQIPDWNEAIKIVADVSDPADMQRAVEQVIDRWDRLDIVFVNAGINGVWSPLEELTPEEWDQTMAVNLKGTFLTVKYAVPYLKEAGGSVIINSSVNGTRMFSNTGATAYACSKAAQVAFAKMIALELAEYRVRVNAICPGAISTGAITSAQHRNLENIRPRVEYPEGAIPLTSGNLGTPEEVAQLVLFLASDVSSHVTGTEVWIDGGQSLLQA